MIYDSFNVVWFTGMSGSGKSTLASYVEDFYKKKQFKIYTIDGDDRLTDIGLELLKLKQKEKNEGSGKTEYPTEWRGNDIY